MNLCEGTDCKMLLSRLLFIAHIGNICLFFRLFDSSGIGMTEYLKNVVEKIV